MTWGTVSAILFSLLGLILIMEAYWLAGASLFPEWVSCCRRRFKQPLRTLAAGLLLGVPWTVGGVALLNAAHPAVKMLGMVVLTGPLFLAFVGSAAVAQRLGEGLLGAVAPERQGLVVFRGGLVLALLFLLPFIGWLVVLPLTLVTGFGASVLGFFQWRRDGREARALEAVGSQAVAEPYSGVES
ncbi:MAG TPA: hypothetical protein VMN36_05790 [Verrucomicrobiales bacterium]|nr:hypothetical protein [Verrucomicrobiales bacterium]